MRGLRRFWVAVLLLAAGCNSTSGGDNPNRIVTGKVDTAIILQSDPEYMSYAQTYLRQQTEVKQQFFEQYLKARDDEQAKVKVRDAYLAAQRKLDTEWGAKTQEFLASRHARLREAAARIAKSKGIDLVVIDTKLYPSVELGGVDITQELLLEVYGKAATPAPEGTSK